MCPLNDMLVAATEPASPVAESFRSLRTAIRQRRLGGGGDGIVLMIASAASGEGKTTTLANLAVTFAQDGKRTVAVDCNLRHPRLHEAFGAASGDGLVRYLRSSAGCEAGDVVQSGGGASQPDVIPAGAAPANPSELLGSERMAQLLDELKRGYDVVLLDSPAALDYTDARLLAERCDGILLVVKRGRTTREGGAKARSRLEQAGATMLGIVLTD